MRFEAKEVDLDLEIIAADGVEHKLKPTTAKVTGAYANRVYASLTEIEKQGKENEETYLQVLCKELALIYGNDAEWWLESLDPITITEVHTHVYETIRGAIKKEKG